MLYQLQNCFEISLRDVVSWYFKTKKPPSEPRELISEKYEIVVVSETLYGEEKTDRKNITYFQLVLVLLFHVRINIFQTGILF